MNARNIFCATSKLKIVPLRNWAMHFDAARLAA
jgi:hypothetical protein